MKDRPLRTTVIGSYPFPGWLEFASNHLDQFGPMDVAEAQDDAVVCAIHDQMAAGLDVITDGVRPRFDLDKALEGLLIEVVDCIKLVVTEANISKSGAVREQTLSQPQPSARTGKVTRPRGPG